MTEWNRDALVELIADALDLHDKRVAERVAARAKLKTINLWGYAEGWTCPVCTALNGPALQECPTCGGDRVVSLVEGQG